MRRHNSLPSHYLWSLNCVVFAQACQTQSVWPAMLSMNHIVWCNALCWDMCSKMIVITEFCYFFFKAWNLLPCVSPIISPSFQSSKPATESKGWWDARGEDNIVQRQQWRQVLIFNSDELISVFRWKGLEILIPKHMWKSIIGPLEQI